MVVNPVTRWFQLIQHNNKKYIAIADFAKPMWLTKSFWPTEILHYQGP